MLEMKLLEFNIIKTCNMYCKGCNHFSSLSDTPDIIPLQVFSNDLQRIRELGIERIRKISLLGGEPLLVKGLEHYIEICRKLYPDSIVEIRTNGILVFSMTNELIKALQDTKVKLMISLYPNMKKNKQKMHQLLVKNKILHQFLVFKDQFCKLLTLEPHQDEPKKYCIAAAPNLENGMLYVCPVSAYINKLNSRFGYTFPEDECINIYEENMTAEQICKFADSTIKLCEYCCPKDVAVFQWECNYKKNVQGTDWVIQDTDVKLSEYREKRETAYREEKERADRVASYKRKIKKAFSLLLSKTRL